MSYKITEIFYSVQSEGFHSGMPAIFIRFAGCNLQCSFCDEAEKDIQFPDIELLGLLKIIEQWKCKNIILTGGEPCLQIDQELFNSLQKRKYKIHIETNGSLPIPCNSTYYDWVTMSPKGVISHPYCNELKIVYNGQSEEEIQNIINKVNRCRVYLQPESNIKEWTEQAIKLLEKNSNWRLSIQWHKLLNIK